MRSRIALSRSSFCTQLSWKLLRRKIIFLKPDSVIIIKSTARAWFANTRLLYRFVPALNLQQQLLNLRLRILQPPLSCVFVSGGGSGRALCPALGFRCVG
jgi:hypothetical protein